MILMALRHLAVVVAGVALLAAAGRGSADQALVDLVALEAKAIRLEQPFQPTAGQVARFSAIVHPGDPGTMMSKDVSPEMILMRGHTFILRDHLPYYGYAFLEDEDAYVVHPMRLGRFLLDNRSSPEIDAFVAAARGVAVDLPNGGLAWYYPRHFLNARMLGPYLRYSGISQGTLLSGMTAVGLADPAVGLAPARRVFEAMRFPFEQGGVNLADRAILEMPSFRAAPEIVLNGWLDALLHLADFVRETGDRDASAFLAENVAFLAEVLPAFDVPEHRISRYSDLSPYRLRLTLERPQDAAGLRVLYLPRHDRLPSLLVPLTTLDNPGKPSPYDNQIVATNGRVLHAWVSCSRLYTTYVLSPGASLAATVNTGVVDPLRSAPGVGGETVELEGRATGDGSYVVVDPSDARLTCGYPTNFMKNGDTNFYHVYHVVSLMLLARSIDDLPGPIERALLEWADRWLGYIETAELRAGLRFTSLDDILKGANAMQLRIEAESADELVSWARGRLSELAAASPAPGPARL
jgi:hypothetical protein